MGTEACDDGDANNSNECLNDCTTARCGDGVVWQGREECDDGDNDDDDACTSACRNAVCGDGLVHAGHEECDDGNWLMMMIAGATARLQYVAMVLSTVAQKSAMMGTTLMGISVPTPASLQSAGMASVDSGTKTAMTAT